MTEEASAQPNVEANALTKRQRKKRKWDQPAEAVISAAASIPGLLPFNGPGALSGIGLPGMFPSLMGVFPSVPTATSAQISPAVSTVQQNAAAIVQKINQDLATKGLVSQTKIQDELIAREIVINDAEPGVRYKLTKRQTQEEIQGKTGTVVITRGRYRAPNGAVDHEKPLYLHISAGVHLKDTAERIRAVDQAAALVEEMLKMGRHKLSGSTSTTQLSSGLITSPLSTVVFVEFEADSSLNLINRICGPNDQYINHIMNETGATVVLKGGSCDSSCTEEIPQPLHLFISADHPKSLDDARSLAENLLETIRSEFVCSMPPYFQPALSYSLQQTVTPYQAPYVATSLEPGRVHSYALAQPSSISEQEKVTLAALSQAAVATSASVIMANSNANRVVFSKAYTAVPPPKQLLTVDKSRGSSEAESESVQSTETKSDSTSASGAESPASLSSSLLSAASPALVPTSNALAAYTGYPGLSYSQQSYGIYPQALQGSQPYSPIVTSYSAYSGLYPQASPLQQVALALQRPPHQFSLKPTSLASESTPLAKPLSNASQGQTEKQEKQRRKFQENPLRAKDPLIDQPVTAQRDDKFGSTELPGGKQQIMPPPNAVPPLSTKSKLSHSMGPPPPKAVPSTTVNAALNVPSRSMPPPSVPVKTFSCSRADTSSIEGIKLVEYGEDDDDVGIADIDRREATPYANGKPFWAA